MNKKIIIGIIGENASGKTTATEYLKENFKAVSFRFSDALCDILKRLYLENSRANFQTLSTALRQNFGDDLLSKIIARDVENCPNNLIVTEGVRRPTDIEYLKQMPNFYLIAIETDEETRFKRVLERREKPDDATKTWEEFKSESAQESEQKIREIAKAADFKINNNGDKKELYQQLEKIIKTVGL